MINFLEKRTAMAQSSLNNQESKTTAQSVCSKCDSKQIYAAKTRNSLGTFAGATRIVDLQSLMSFPQTWRCHPPSKAGEGRSYSVRHGDCHLLITASILTQAIGSGIVRWSLSTRFSEQHSAVQSPAEGGECLP